MVAGKASGSGQVEEEVLLRDKRRRDIPTVHVRHHVDLGLCLCDFLLRGDLRAAAHAEERHCESVCVCVCVWCAASFVCLITGVRLESWACVVVAGVVARCGSGGPMMMSRVLGAQKCFGAWGASGDVRVEGGRRAMEGMGWESGVDVTTTLHNVSRLGMLR
jgi:hypothetical protein